jgi:hypothetical protein
MRIWDVHPGFLSRQRLLGEHAELHAILSVLTRGLTGYSRHPETLRWKGHRGALRLRHELLVSEMLLRGLGHHSPAPHRGPRGRWPEAFIDPPGDQLDILARKYGPVESGRIDLPRGAQELWAAHKYSVLARDQRAYRDIGRRVARMRRGSDIHPLALELVELLRRAPDPGSLENALEHMWGHVRRLAGHRTAGLSGSALLERIRREALASGEPYLVQSTALSELSPWCIDPL